MLSTYQVLGAVPGARNTEGKKRRPGGRGASLGCVMGARARAADPKGDLHVALFMCRRALLYLGLL